MSHVHTSPFLKSHSGGTDSVLWHSQFLMVFDLKIYLFKFDFNKFYVLNLTFYYQCEE